MTGEVKINFIDGKPDEFGGLPTFPQGQNMVVQIPNAQIITCEIRDKNGNMVICDDVDNSMFVLKIERLNYDLTGQAHILIHFYDEQNEWDAYETDFQIV